MEKQNFTEKEIEEMKDEFDKSLKEFHDKAVPDIIKTLGTYPPIVALFGIGSIANAIIKQQFETFNQTISKYFGITSKKIKKMSEEVYIIKRGEKYIKYYNISLFLFMATFFVIIILAIKLICIIS